VVILTKFGENKKLVFKNSFFGAVIIPDARAGKKEGGWGEGIFARPRFPPPPNFVPMKLARRLKINKVNASLDYILKILTIQLLRIMILNKLEIVKNFSRSYSHQPQYYNPK